MTGKQRIKNIIDTFNNYNIPVLSAKGDDYSVKNDVNFFFKEIGKRISVDKYQVWSILFEKHIVAIETWISKKDLKSEDIRMRIVDAINYLFILWTLIEEDDNATTERIIK